MTDSAALNELQDKIARREPIIGHMLVIKAIHDMLQHGIDPANEVEDLLTRAGYEQTKRGDWAIFDVLAPD
ncbi:hypothetical protein D3C72_550880 [compost metagenome]